MISSFRARVKRTLAVAGGIRMLALAAVNVIVPTAWPATQIVTTSPSGLHLVVDGTAAHPRVLSRSGRLEARTPSPPRSLRPRPAPSTCFLTGQTAGRLRTP